MGTMVYYISDSKGKNNYLKGTIAAFGLCSNTYCTGCQRIKKIDENFWYLGTIDEDFEESVTAEMNTS